MKVYTIKFTMVYADGSSSFSSSGNPSEEKIRSDFYEKLKETVAEENVFHVYAVFYVNRDEVVDTITLSGAEEINIFLEG